MFGKFVTANERREDRGGGEGEGGRGSEDWLDYDYRTVAFFFFALATKNGNNNYGGWQFCKGKNGRMRESNWITRRIN